MKEQSGVTYESSPWAKELWVAAAKEGKTVNKVAGVLGALPWQTGAIVDDPKHLHVISCDSGALSGAHDFLLKSCIADKALLGFRVYNMEEDIRRAYASQESQDRALFNTLIATIDTVQKRARAEGGIHVLLFSSLTTIGKALQRAISGPVTEKRSNMDQNKWSDMNMQLAELQNFAHADAYHCVWEAHLGKKPSGEKEGGQQVEKDTLQMASDAGKNWANNVEQIFRYRRGYGQKHPNTKVDKTWADCAPTFDFVANGRRFNERLSAVEPDITQVYVKLGLYAHNEKLGGAAPKKNISTKK